MKVVYRFTHDTLREQFILPYPTVQQKIDHMKPFLIVLSVFCVRWWIENLIPVVTDHLLQNLL